jgi:hypothetical protein
VQDDVAGAAQALQMLLRGNIRPKSQRIASGKLHLQLKRVERMPAHR